MGGCGCECGSRLCNGIDVGEWEGVGANMGVDCVMGLMWEGVGANVGEDCVMGLMWVSGRMWM